MKAIFTLFVGLFCLLTNTTIAQIEKGTWLIDGGAGFGTDLSNDADNYNISIAPSVGYFVSLNWMIGLGFSRSYTKQSIAKDDFEYIGHTTSITPFMRYFFPRLEKSLQFFLGVGCGLNTDRTTFTVNSNKDIQKDTYYTPFVSGGGDYFIHPNIALEGILQYRRIFGDTNGAHSLVYNIGLQFFLPKTTVEVDASQSTALGKGSWLVGANASGGWFNIGEFDNLNASLTPSAGYFFSDHFVLGAAFQLAFADQNAIVYPQPFARYYIAKNDAFWQPFVAAGFGTRLQFADKFSEPSFFGLNAMAGLGLDVFVTRSVALEGILEYNGRELEGDSSRSSLDFNIGFQFFLSPN